MFSSCYLQACFDSRSVLPRPHLCAVGYRIWINGLFAWHKSYPEMSLHFLQMVRQWFGSKQIALAHAALMLGDAVRNRGVRDLKLPLATGLLTGIHADMMPDLYWHALDLLKSCEPIYPHLNVTAVWTAVLKLLESVTSWKDRQVRRQTLSTVVGFLEATMIDDETMALATHNLLSIMLADARGNLDEAAAKNQKLIGLLRHSNVRGWKRSISLLSLVEYDWVIGRKL